uniref:Uncharacterized protein n=1 Tax=Bubo bubo TaxID=30461 RepID=A0A8C0EYW9_BUBBB
YGCYIEYHLSKIVFLSLALRSAPAPCHEQCLQHGNPTFSYPNPPIIRCLGHPTPLTQKYENKTPLILKGFFKFMMPQGFLKFKLYTRCCYCSCCPGHFHEPLK